MLENILIIVACLLVIEGIMPSIAPDAWKKKMEMLSQFEPGQIRTVGMVLVALGVLLLAVVRLL